MHGISQSEIESQAANISKIAIGSEITQLFFCKIEQTLIFLSGEELHAHHRTG